MTPDIAAALRDGGISDDYCARPAYQRNDYVGWIGQARSEATRARRIAQMIEELRRGGVYMGMAHRPSAKD